MKYRSDIDGLRCLAVLPVVLFHAGISGVPGGFVGVDVFFVISGFLITGILKSDIEENRYSLVRFYERRIRRILPALTFTVLVSWVLAYTVFLPNYFVDFSKSVVSTSIFISNLYFWKFSGYFDHSALLRPLLHTWSLAVEEQFYIFMPVLMYLVFRFAKPFAFWIFSGLALASLALSIYSNQVAPTANFFLLPTRAWELLLGGLLSMASLRPLKSLWMRHGLGVAGLAMILFPAVLYSEATPFPGLAALPPCVGAALLIYTGAESGGLATRLLSSRPIVFIGKVSYSLYLVHWPLIVFFRYISLTSPSLLSAVFIVASSLALAVFSWWFIERPFRQKSFIASRKVLFAGAIVSLALMASVGVAGVMTGGFPNRFSKLPDVPPPAKLTGWRDGTCFFEGNYAFHHWSAEACDLTHSAGDNVLLWGDSYAAHYAPGVTGNADHIPYHVYQYTAAGCPPVLSYYSYARPLCGAFNQNALQIIAKLHIKKVVLSARWIDLQSRGIDELDSTLKVLKAHGGNVDVIGQSPIFVADVGLISYERSDGRKTSDQWFNSFNGDLNEKLRSVVKPDPASGPYFINPIESLCSAGQCTYRQYGQYEYSDDGHLTEYGSKLAVSAYFPLIERASTFESQDAGEVKTHGREKTMAVGK